jgi:exopolysaccharide biosynthesis protein
MKKISLIILSVFLAFVFTLSGCTKTEYITVTDTLVVTETITTTPEHNYSYKVGDALVLYITEVLKERGLLNSVAAVTSSGDSIKLIFAGQINSEIVGLAQEAIDEIAPGFPLNVMVGTIVTSLV